MTTESTKFPGEPIGNILDAVPKCSGIGACYGLGPVMGLYRGISCRLDANRPMAHQSIERVVIMLAGVVAGFSE
jgi:hypothetical protein